jgi:hypothetical protein
VQGAYTSGENIKKIILIEVILNLELRKWVTISSNGGIKWIFV